VSARVRYALVSVLLVLAYLGAAKFGLLLAFVGRTISPVWPPTGLFLAALFLLGERYWPAVFVGAFVSTWIEGPPLLITLLIAIGNTLEPLVISLLLRRARVAPSLERVRDVAAFLAACVVGTVLSTTIGIATLALTGRLPTYELGTATGVWWVGNYISAILLGPALLALRATPSVRRASTGECVVMLNAVALASAVVFQAQFRWVFLLLPFTIWASLRCGPRFTALSTFVISAFALFSTAHGAGPFAAESVHQALTVLETFLATVSVLGLILSALTAERLRTEVRLRESEARYRAIVEDQTELICRFVPGGALTFVSESYCRAFGRPRRALVGADVLHAALPEERAALAARLGELRAPGKSLTLAFRVRGVQGHAGESWQQWTFSALGDAEREAGRAGVRETVHEIQGVGRDVTEQRRRETALVEREEQLRQSQKMEAVGQLAGGIAHDFNNLLTTVLASADMVLDQLGGDAPIREDVEEIRQAALRAAALTRQLLTFSRKQVTEATTVDVNALVGELGKMLRRLIGEDIELSLRLKAEEATVYADRGLLEQVVINLAVNGRDAMPEGGRLTIDTGRLEVPEPAGSTPSSSSSASAALAPGAYVVLTVTDTGHGMSDAVKARIFEPFFTTKEQGRGTGLGLATVYGIVRQFRGTISVTSAPGHGATFRILLPYAVPTAAPAVRRTPTSMPRVSETVLLVDDEDTVRRIAQRVLEADGYTVLSAGDPHEALALAARRDPIHVLLTDVVMPGMSGPKLAQRLKVLRPELRVVYMSGYPDSVTGSHGVLEPGTVYVQKPFVPADLRAKLRQAVRDEAVAIGD
jgi:PAS domain S-box-containing protein